MSEPALLLRNAVLPIRRSTAPFDFIARRGETWMLLGPLGGGKTTLLKVLATLIRLDAGRYVCLGTDVSDFDAADRAVARRRLGVCLEQDGLIEAWSVLDNLAVLPRYHQPGPQSEIERRVWSYLDSYHQNRDVASRGVAGLTREERRGIALLRALFFDPPVLIIDGVAPHDVAQYGLSTRFQRRLNDPGPRRRWRPWSTRPRQALARTGPGDRLAVMIDGRLTAQGRPGYIADAADEETSEWLRSVTLA